MKIYRGWLLGSAGSILSALLVTMATAQEADYSVADNSPAAVAPLPADKGGAALATSGEPNGDPCCYYGLFAGPFEGPEPWTLSPKECPVRVGGWADMGYYTGSDGQLNTRPDKLDLNQTWLWIERTADGSKGWDWGYRADLMYGTDGRIGQSYGNQPGTYDYQNGWDHGAYDWALPQLYATLAYDKFNVKVGHFFTPMGYEVLNAPGNFFYSHAITWNSEPMTHTGALAEYALTEDVKLVGGWLAGWDTGFDQFEGGSAWLGGFNAKLFERLTMTYYGLAGNLGWRGEGYNHCLIFDYKINERWNYVFQTDMVDSDGSYTAAYGENPVFHAGQLNDQVGIAQYLFYKINCKLTAGARVEWWKGDGISYNEVTYGVNYKPIPNLCLRPEVRHQWSPTESADFADNTVFGIDGYVTF